MKKVLMATAAATLLWSGYYTIDGQKVQQNNIDSDYKRAVELIENEKHHIRQTVAKDPHTPKETKTVTRIDWEKAYKAFKKSAFENDNPAAAYFATDILDIRLGTFGQYTGDYGKLVKLQAALDTCSSTMKYAKALEQGIGMKPDLNGALSRYRKAIEICEDDWRLTVARSKAAKIENQIEN